MPDRKETPGWSNLTSIRRQKIPSGSSSTTSTYQVLRARLSRVAGFDSANRTHERAGRLDSRSRDGILVLKTDGLGPPGGNHRAWLRPGLDISRGGTQKRRVSLAGSWNTQRQATYARPEPTIPVVDRTRYNGVARHPVKAGKHDGHPNRSARIFAISCFRFWNYFS